jgi:hypothetical protein
MNNKSNEKNIFEVATRNKFRFAFRGSLSIEDLWDLGLKDLDTIFKALNGQLKQEKEESLLETKTQANEELDMKIQIVKHIVQTKLEEDNLRAKAKEMKQQKQKILELIESKQNADLANKSLEELQKMLGELNN